MKDEEKNLIENLFHRLKNTELNSSERDHSADDLIQKLVKNQPASSYYMAQTILIQETAIKKMSVEIEELKKRIEVLNTGEKKQKPSFLSNFFKTNSNSQTVLPDNNIWKNKEAPVQYYNSNVPISPTTSPVLQTTRSNGFLSNALQTATGVAGGMILGNMLMNVFNHAKSEESFDTINKSSENYTEEHLLNNESHNYINDIPNESDINQHLCNYSNLENSNNFEQIDDVDINDDNFI